MPVEFISPQHTKTMTTIIYTTTACPRCVQVKAKMKAEGRQYIEMVIDRDVSRETFSQQYPEARSFPHVVELPENEGAKS